MPADPVADVEPEPAQEPEYAAADPVADVESDTIAEPDAMRRLENRAGTGAMPADPVADVEPEPAQEVDPVPSEPELAQRLQDCEVLSIPAAASRVEEYIQRIWTGRAARWRPPQPTPACLR